MIPSGGFFVGEFSNAAVCLLIDAVLRQTLE
jgi:hypothetical protein